MRLSSRNKMLLGVFYRPPSSGVQPLEALAEILTNVSHHYNSILVVGDFNLPSLKWNLDNGLPTSSGSIIDDMFVDDILTANCLHQVNFSVTRGNNILDLVLCSEQLQVSCGAGDNLFPSDHNSVRLSFRILAKTNSSHTSRPIYNFRKADLNDLNRTIECIPWCLLEATDDCDAATSLFYDLIEAALIDVVPVVRPRRPSPPWFDCEVHHALKAKERAFRRKKVNPNPHNTTLFKAARSHFKQLVRTKYSSYLLSVAADIGKNSKRFWSFIKARSRQHPLPSVLRSEQSGLDASDPAGKAGLLMDYFQSIHLPDSAQSDVELPGLYPVDLDAMPAISITKSDVLHKLRNIDVSKASGPDNLSGFVLNSCANVLCGPLTYLFRRATLEGCFPSYWKAANIVPVHKSGKKEMVTNYRPISLLPQVSKVFEKIVCEQILCHVQPAVSGRQHGFISGRDCSTNLTALLREAYHAVDRQEQLDVIYTDFSKAFDRVNHDFLLHKLSSYHFHPDVLVLLRSYLTCRKHRVVVDSHCSNWNTVPSGVPQGSILGPILFALFVNDIPQCISNSKCLLFADDLKVFYKVSSPADTSLLQDDLHRIMSWSSMWRLYFNFSKCSVLSLSLKKKPILCDYTLGDNVLNRVAVQKDLGILVDSRLTFVPHVDSIIKKANRMCGLVWRNLRSLKDEHALRTIYCSLIRPHLEYSTVVFNSISTYQATRIKRVQKRFLVFMYKTLNNSSDVNNLDYLDLCALYRMPLLKLRRDVNDCLFLYKYFHNRFSITEVNPFSLYVPVRRTRYANEHIFHVPWSRVEVTKRGFISRISSTYNGLHGACDVFGAPSLNMFRSQVLRALSSSN